MGKPKETELQKALRVVLNAECAAQQAITDRELRRSLVRNILKTYAPKEPIPDEEELDGEAP